MVHLGLSTDCELVLVQQVCELRDIEMQELVQLVDLSEMELEEVLSCCLQVGTVHAIGQGGNTCRGRQGTGGADQWKDFKF